MSHLIINGGRKLHGSIPNQSAKNATLPIMAACLMIGGTTKLVDVPDIEEINRMVELLASIGVVIVRPEKGVMVLTVPKKLSLKNLDPQSCDIRSSLDLLGALAAREKKYKLYKSGGCKLGKRTIRPIVYALQKLGIEIESKQDYYEVHNKNLIANTIVMYESGDVATNIVIMAAVLIKGTTTIKMASANYMVQDVCCFLNKAGARISGIGTTTLVIEGVAQLNSLAEAYPIMPDPIVAMTLIAAGIVTSSHVTIKNCPLEFLELELLKLEVMGQKYTLKNKRLSANGMFDIVDVELFPSALIAPPDKLECRPFPGLNIDNLPLFIPIVAAAEGRTLIHDWVYEDRALYSLELKKLGAAISLIDAHRVWVEGPTVFKPNEVICPPALRPAVNVLLCMLGAKGKSVLRNTYVIERGYENVYETLNKAGADIQVVQE